MNVLMLGPRSANRVRVARLLRDAGMRVDICGTDEWACAGLEGHCPLDRSGVDVAVAVAVRGKGFAAQGFACARRASVPVVTVGATASDPALRFATACVARPDDRLVRAVREAASNADDHRRAVEEAFAKHPHYGETRVVAAVRRERSIRITLESDLPVDRQAAAVDTARDAVRRHDPTAPSIDISVTRRDREPGGDGPR